MMENTHLVKDAKAWVKRKSGPDEIVRIVADTANNENAQRYLLYTAFDENPDSMGKILFDVNGYWIYDGENLSVEEQEQVARFIINYVEPL
jgi:hypothetical protein